MKRLIAALLLLGAMLSIGSPALAETERVGAHQVQPAVDLLKRLGIISGDPGGSMRLRDTITRAELVKIVVVAMGQGAAAYQARLEPPAFKDVEGHWAQGFVAVARRLGIAGGYDDSTFRPGNVVTNAEALTMLLRATGLKPSGAWPEAYLTAAANAGVLTDSLRKALPWDGEATRGAALVLAERAFTLIEDAKGTTLLQRVFGGRAPGITVTAQGVEAGVTRLSVTTLSISAPGAVLVQVNGQPAWASQNETFTYSTELKPGRNEWLVIAVDDRGNLAQHFVSIERR